MPSICMYILANLRFSLSFLRSFSLSSCSFNRFTCNSAILLTPEAKFPIARVCDLGAWRFSCDLIIVLFLLRSLELLFDFSLSHKQQVKSFLLLICFRLIHFRFLRLTFPYHSSDERFSL